ncbi:MAG TPA: glutathione S-transferase [Stellaceae bacterium]|nr:glutathione S-transferase [Stellaceae bacterium]
MKPTKPILLYGFKKSGHSHRAELALRLMNIPFEFRPVDLAGGEQRGAPFQKLNPFGTVPVIDDNGTIIADSVAILVYLASKYDEARSWLPTDPAKAALVQRWLSVAQGYVFNGPCAARLVTVFGVPLDHERAKATAHTFFTILNRELKGRRFLVGEGPTLADIALYSYIAHAPEGGVSLEPYPEIRAWLACVEKLPRFEGMPRTKAGLAA